MHYRVFFWVFFHWMPNRHCCNNNNKKATTKHDRGTGCYFAIGFLPVQVRCPHKRLFFMSLSVNCLVTHIPFEFEESLFLVLFMLTQTDSAIKKRNLKTQYGYCLLFMLVASEDKKMCTHESFSSCLCPLLNSLLLCTCECYSIQKVKVFHLIDCYWSHPFS